MAVKEKKRKKEKFKQSMKNSELGICYKYIINLEIHWEQGVEWVMET